MPHKVTPEVPRRPGPSELWQQAGGDKNKYVELMVEHGHLIKRPPDEDIVGGRGPNHRPIRPRVHRLQTAEAEAEIYALDHFHEWLTQRIRRTSMRKAAELAGVHYSSISRLISGSREPSLKMALRLIRALGVSPRQR